MVLSQPKYFGLQLSVTRANEGTNQNVWRNKTAAVQQWCKTNHRTWSSKGQGETHSSCVVQQGQIKEGALRQLNLGGKEWLWLLKAMYWHPSSHNPRQNTNNPSEHFYAWRWSKTICYLEIEHNLDECLHVGRSDFQGRQSLLVWPILCWGFTFFTFRLTQKYACT